MKNDEHFDYDILVVGAGTIGLTFACLLEKSELRVAVIEQGVAPISTTAATGLKYRAINHASQDLFERLGLWRAMQPSPYEEMRVWESNQQDLLHFRSWDIKKPDIGNIVDEDLMHYLLFEKAKTCSHITFFYELAPEKIFRLGSKIKLSLTNKKKVQLCLSARLLIGADGQNSWVRTAAHISHVDKPYFQKAVIANVQTECSHRKTAWQRFLPEGPLAFLPLRDEHQAAIVWTNYSKTTEDLIQSPVAIFEEKITESFESRLGKVKLISDRLAFSLSLQHADVYVKPGIVLMGDAAHRVHPLAGLGLNLGLGDVARMVEILDKAKKNGQLIDDFAVLRAYERYRRAENTKVLFFVDKIKELFMTQHAIALPFRQRVIAGINQYSVVKNYFLRAALEG